MALAKHLNTRDIKAIVNLIRGWEHEKITWEDICDEAAPLIGWRPTRQTLCNTERHPGIKDAYDTVKRGLKEKGPSRPRSSSLSAADARISNLERQIDELKERNRAYQELFVRWQYNSYKHGLKEHQLNELLPLIDRERSDQQRR